MDLYKIIMMKENYSEWTRQAMVEKLVRENDDQLIDLDIKKHEDKIRELRNLKKSKNYDVNSEMDRILEQSLQKFKQRNHDVEIGDSQNRDWIKRMVIPDLRRAGCRLDEYKLLEMFKAGRVDVSR